MKSVMLWHYIMEIYRGQSPIQFYERIFSSIIQKMQIIVQFVNIVRFVRFFKAHEL